MNAPITHDGIARLDHRCSDVAEAIRGVMFAGYRVEADLIGVDDFLPLGRTAAEIADADTRFLGIRVDGGLAAVTEVEELERGLCRISALVVSPAHFRRGLATALLRHVIESHPCADITVSTAVANLPALELYAAHGFSRQSYSTTPDGIPLVDLLRPAASREHPPAAETR